MSRTALLLVCLGIAAPAAAQNLLVNGDFETGDATGWTTWYAGWTGTRNWQFNNTEAGHNGNYCLRLYGAQGSFGVYQQVTTVPGRRYKIDGYWKGTKYGSDNWYEYLLINGPFSMTQADSGGAAVIANFMYAYDPGTYAVPADFGWLWAHTQDDIPVDWNNRDGVREASGTTMTVVLKTGACCSSAQSSVWFDDVSLVQIFPDYDADGDVDLADFGAFLSCFNGANRPAAADGCTSFDWDQDDDVDLTDFSIFQICFNGPNRPVALSCQ